MAKSSTLDGGAAEIYACNGGLNQEWVTGPQGEIVNVNSGKCLDDSSDSTTAGTQLVQKECYGQAGELWQNT